MELVLDWFVRALLDANDAKRAWQVVRGSGCVPEVLDDSTWGRFLD